MSGGYLECQYSDGEIEEIVDNAVLRLFREICTLLNVSPEEAAERRIHQCEGLACGQHVANREGVWKDEMLKLICIQQDILKMMTGLERRIHALEIITQGLGNDKQVQAALAILQVASR